MSVVSVSSLEAPRFGYSGYFLHEVRFTLCELFLSHKTPYARSLTADCLEGLRVRPLIDCLKQATYNGESIGYGVYGENGNFQGAAVLGKNSAPNSETFAEVVDDFIAGVWGDTSHSNGDRFAFIGTADDAGAGYFLNNSADNTTFVLRNSASPTTGEQSPMVFAAIGSNGECLIDVSGNLSCNGNISGVVSAQSGTHQVETYAMQSAESWLEDAGTAQLVKGAAHVEIETSFGQTVNAGVAYHVFLTPNGTAKASM